jgi:mono/diheme cytochrome c family protein
MKRNEYQTRLYLNGAACLGFLLVVCSYSGIAQNKPWPVPKDYLAMSNPGAASNNDIKEGKTLYMANCSPCHGAKGKGDGVAAASLTPKPADHTSAIMLNETDGSIFYKITEGRAPMPQYKNAFTDKQRWELVAYIRTLCKATKK